MYTFVKLNFLVLINYGVNITYNKFALKNLLQLPIISLMGISTTCPIHLNSLVIFTTAYDERKEKS